MYVDPISSRSPWRTTVVIYLKQTQVQMRTVSVITHMAHLESAFTTHEATFCHQSERSRKLVTRMASAIQMRSKLRGFLCVLYRQHSETKRDKERKKKAWRQKQDIYREAVRQKNWSSTRRQDRQDCPDWLKLEKKTKSVIEILDIPVSLITSFLHI